ncbi:MAG TPA: tetratricopeptide repeat protein, partial [Flavobacteriales bacterium]|nr:tetratricopeptide repeat protein [Flavobacteriales bacterium]
MKRLIHILVISFALLMGFDSQAQRQKAPPTDAEIDAAPEEDRFDAGNGLMELKQYYQSLRMWKSLLKKYPDNPNFNYKAGVCQLEVISGRKNSINYLIKTVGKTAKNYDPTDFSEDKVPIDALFYLGRAYHLDAQFDKAIETFNELKSKLNPKHVLYNDIDKNIQWANNAKTMVAN